MTAGGREFQAAGVAQLCFA